MIRNYELPDPLEVVNASAHTVLPEIALAIESARLKCPRIVPVLMQTCSSEMVYMASAMFTAGRIAGVRQERSKQRRLCAKMEAVINA